jgi:putative tryptophan/tyrosine transport system substrate-binding protein
MRATHQGQQSARTAPTGRTHDCKRHLHRAPHDLLHSGGHPHMRRRRFIAVIAGAAAWPLAAHAQAQERVRRLGVLMPYPENDPRAQAFVTAFAQALGRFGWVEGKNIRIDYRFAAGDPTLYKTHAVELVGLSPDAILADASPAVAALREQTSAIPIVFVLVVDPVGQGFVQSLARPGGNITGFSAYDAPIMGKWLQFLKEVAPSVTRVAVIFNPDTAPYAPLFNRAIEAAAPSFGMRVTLAAVHDDAAIEEAIAAHAREPGGGLICLPESFAITHRDVMIAAAARHGLPLIGTDLFPKDGALMSYWFDGVEVHAEAASYIDRILRGANPADLPVQQPTKYSLIINLKTAKALGLTVPPAMLDLADQVIE